MAIEQKEKELILEEMSFERLSIPKLASMIPIPCPKVFDSRT